MKILGVVGARPQRVKRAPIHKTARAAVMEHVIVPTGQHCDPMLSKVFFEVLGTGAPDAHLVGGCASNGAQTEAMLPALDADFDERHPDKALVQRDTNSTVAATLSAAKTHTSVARLATRVVAKSARIRG